MSAQKCGTPMPIEAFEEAVLKAIQTPVRPPLLVSHRAYKMLDKIRKKCPGWEPTVEAEIWWKARSLGMIEDEE